MRLRGEIETWQPMLNGDFAKEAADWDEQKAAWDRGERPDLFDADRYGDISFEEWHGERPQSEWYVPYDVNGDLPWWQMYETVSEGTPVTPAFPSAEELIEHLATVGQTYEAGETDGPWGHERARKFVLHERWFPSCIIRDGQVYEAKSGLP